jgi:DNA primase large subunit
MNPNFEKLKILAKYPFLKEAKEYVDSLHLTLNDLQNHPVYSGAVELGRQRVIDAVNNSLHQEIEDKISAEFSILSYVIARIFINLTRNKNLMQRYAQGEAQQMYEFLREEEDDTTRKKIMSEVNLEIPEENNLPFSTYLKFTKNLSKRGDPKWKLVNRELTEGKVKINEWEKLILLREAIQEKILKPITLKGVPKEFFDIANNLNSLLGVRREVKIKELNEDALPLCIKKILQSLETGEISHQGMFILATFFINLGLRKEKILRIFSKFPKFSEEKTRYQLEFLSGEKSNVKYTCPGCDKIKFYGLCPEDCGVKHPISYYKSRMRRR